MDLPAEAGSHARLCLNRSISGRGFRLQPEGARYFFGSGIRVRAVAGTWPRL